MNSITIKRREGWYEVRVSYTDRRYAVEHYLRGKWLITPDHATNLPVTQRQEYQYQVSTFTAAKEYIISINGGE